MRCDLVVMLMMKKSRQQNIEEVSGHCFKWLVLLLSLSLENARNYVVCISYSYIYVCIVKQ